MKIDYVQELALAKSLGRQAGSIIREFFDADQKVERKADGSVLTIADTTINRFVIDEISKRFDDGVIGEEESNSDYGMGRRWFCDPIDGTKAFVWGTPTAAFSLGLVVDGIPILGVVYDPFLDKLYEGIRGEGSYCNGQALRVSEKGLPGEYVAVTSSVEKLVEEPASVRRLVDRGGLPITFSGAVYKACLVSRGRLVGYFEAGVNAHDMAAVHVIVEEAGGRVTAPDGSSLDYTQPFKGVVISNGIVHEELVACSKLLLAHP